MPLWYLGRHTRAKREKRVKHMANGKDNKALQATVDAWSKLQKQKEELQGNLEAINAEQAAHIRTMYQALGTSAFPVKALGGRKYRCIFHPEKKSEKTGKTTVERYSCIPVPDFETEHSF